MSTYTTGTASAGGPQEDEKESSSGDQQGHYGAYQPQEANNKRVIHPPAPTHPQTEEKNGSQGPNDPDHHDHAAAPQPEKNVVDKPRAGYMKSKIGAQWNNTELEGEDFEAALEHANLSNVWSPLSLIRKEYGAGVYVYFKYINYLVGINLAIGLFGLIFYIVAASKGLSTDTYSGLDLLFLGAAPHSAKTAWYGLISVSMLGAFLAAPIYQRYQRYITEQWKEEEHIDPNEDVIEENLNYTERQRRIRRSVSLLLFLVIVVIQGLITYGIHSALSDSDSEIAAQILGAMVTLMKSFWKFLSKFMTKYEKHRRKTRYIEYDTGKVFFMRMANVLSVYLTKFLTEQSVIDEGQTCEDANEAADCDCPLAAMGQQFFWILIFEMSGANLIQVVIPWIMLKYNERNSLTSGQGDEANKQEFDLPDEFTEVLYRQFIIYLGTIVFPLLPLLGVASYILEYWVDKYRLIYLSQKQLSRPHPVRAKLLFFFHIFAAAAALFSFPNGLVFLFSGIDLRNNCRFW
eukprot:gb/GECG01016683.1/.p1 GENE.gb/GECG01016683.1/~~gb/GECG01016683.1/.p1  ORF type:complete len:517 (+),score=62.36 gb/GECG01016683.1/:1-1551(+)